MVRHFTQMVMTSSVLAWCLLLLACCGADVYIPPAPDSNLPEAQLMRCINSNQPGRITTTWEKAIHDEAAHYEVIGIFWSQKNNSLPLTVATQLSYNRKWQLKAMCKSWPGPISAVMHMPTVRVPTALIPPHTTRDALDKQMAKMKKRALQKVYELHQQLDLTLRCKLDLMLVHEQYSDFRTMMLYPVNTLRNLARLQARTPLVGLIDVDVLISQSLSLELHDPIIAERYIRDAADNKMIWVLPAFVINGRKKDMNLHREIQLAEKLVRNTKEALLPLWDRKVIERFDPTALGHMATQYDRWFSTADPYVIQWKNRYEPWVYGDRHAVPWADSRFRGYGKNKIIILQALNYSGFQFVVHPRAFLMHRSHPSTAVKAWLADTIKKEMEEGRYRPKVDRSVRACLQALSWWNSTLGNSTTNSTLI